MKTPVGIDLGTTISVVAHVSDDGVVEVVRNDDDGTLTPSVVLFEHGGEAVVGAEAKASAAVMPERVVAAVKRSMGTDRSVDVDGVSYRPEGVSAIILRALADSAARRLGVGYDDLVAVVTVPAYFGTAEREATATAARIAGLDVLDLVAEPVAAALSIGLGSEQSGHVLVYDLGGGTFDATVIEFGARGPRVVAVDGSSRLGGMNFDERLGELILERYALAADDEDAEWDEEFVLRVHADAEDLKKRLSRTETATMSVTRRGRSARIAVSRPDFEAATRTLVEETLRVVDRVIEAAVALGADKPAQVLLTGGSTRMPCVTSALEAHLRIPVRLHDPDTAVARGAAIHCRALVARPNTLRREIASDGVGIRERVLGSAPVRSVLPRALGLKIHDSDDPEGKRVVVQHVVAANTPLPLTGVVATFATVVDSQELVRVELMEQAGPVAGEEVGFNRRILDGELSGLPLGLPAGSPIDVELTVGTDGRIECVARERSSGAELVLESYMEGVADAQETAAQSALVSRLIVRS